MPRIGKKKARVLAQHKRLGELKAEVQHEYKSVKWIADMLPFLPEKYKKNAILWIKHLLEEHLSEMPKNVAILGMTIIVKNLIDKSEELRSLLPKPELKFRVDPALPHFEPAWPVSLLFGTEKEKYEGMFPDWADWLISFSLAYIIVDHGGQIILGLGESVKGLTGMLAFLLA